MRALKSLGQNFLTDRNIIRKILKRPDYTGSDIVLEIGPGRGAMTGDIASKAKKLYAVEKDRRLAELLAERFADCAHVKIISGDILKMNLDDFAGAGSLRIFGNIPYNITTPILEHLTDHRSVIADAYLTVQKEYAERLTARTGTKAYGSVSIYLNYYWHLKREFVIRAACFNPKPKVDSCFISLTRKKEIFIEENDERKFFNLVHRAFQKRRKMIHSTLTEISNHKLDKEAAGDILQDAGIDRRARPENISLSGFADLYRRMQNDM